MRIIEGSFLSESFGPQPEAYSVRERSLRPYPINTSLLRVGLSGEGFAGCPTRRSYVWVFLEKVLLRGGPDLSVLFAVLIEPATVRDMVYLYPEVVMLAIRL